VHIIHVISPALLLVVLASAVTMFLYLDAIPYTSFLLKSQVGDDVEELLYATLRKDGCINHPKLNYEIHAKTVHGRILHDAIFKRRAPGGKGFDLVACAREAELHLDETGKQILVTMRQCEIVQGNTVGFLDDTVWPVEVPGDLGGNMTKLRAMDMTWNELFEYQEKEQREIETLTNKIDAHQVQIDHGRGEAHFQKHVSDMANERRVCENHILSMQSELHMRPALALGCFCFALIGCPIGIWFSKNDYLSAFITCFLPIVTIYYPLLFCLINMTRAGKMSPWLGIYDADLAMMLAGMILFRRLTRS
jgi:lipopolysaccharide export system permease protein